MVRVVLLLLASLVAAACAAVRTNIAVTHALPPMGAGKTVAIVPYTENLAAAPDYQANTQKLAAHLEAEGYRIVPATGGPSPDYLAFFLYRIDNGTVVDLQLSRPHPQTGSLYDYGYRTAFSPGARPTYRRMVILEIFESARFRPNQPGLLRGRARLQRVRDKPGCVFALFQDFPGQSGAIRSIDVSAASTCGLDRFG